MLPEEISTLMKSACMSQNDGHWMIDCLDAVIECRADIEDNKGSLHKHGNQRDRK